MRVLHVMEATIGGTRRHLRDVARGQRSRGLDVHLAVSTLRQPEFEEDLVELERAGCSVTRLPMVRAIRPPADTAHWRALARLLETVRPDVVHTHSSKAGVLGRAASIATGIGARVHTPHTFAFLFEAMFPPWKRALFREIESWFAAQTHAVVAVSASEARTFRASGVVDAGRVHVVPNGIDPAPWIDAVPHERASLGVARDATVAALVGLLNVAKGQDLAIDALAEPGLEDLVLVVAGHGEERERLEARARSLGVAERVRFLGHRTDVPRIVAACDFLLLPSRWEGMPYTVLEAMAAARPVVATPVDGARDVVVDGENGFLAARIGADAIAAAVVELLRRSSDERMRMGAAGRARVLAECTAERMVDGLVAVYERVS